MMRSKFFLVLSATAVFAASELSAQEVGTGRRLGNSGAAQAQAVFARGLDELHNFQYSEAAASFREARRIDPDFVLAYWGEAMTHSHVLWGQHDVAAGRAALAGLADRSGRLAGTPVHERTLLSAAEALFAHDSLRAGLRALSARLEEVHAARPADVDAAAFHGLSIIAQAPPGPAGMRARAPGVNVLERAFDQDPRHAGVAHYLIHAYDDVQHAALGLRAAEIYADLAPASPHAQHMPSHIFLPLGRWGDAVRVNQVAYDASVRLQTASGWPQERRDWHALLWLSYSLAQQGRYARLRDVVEHFDHMAGTTGNASAIANAAAARAILALESGEWERAPSIAEAIVGAPANQANVLVATAMSAVQRRDSVQIDSIRSIVAGLGAGATGAPAAVEVVSLMIEALSRAARDDLPGVLGFAGRAAALERSQPVLPGIHLPIKPAGELYGEALLGADRPADARAHFLAVLERIPRRPLSLWGLARAQVALGDSAAAVTTLRELGGVWAEADPESTRMRRFRTLLETLDSPPQAEARSLMTQSLEEEVARVAQDMLATVRARDIEGMMSFYDSVAGFVHYENGREVSWQELAPQMRQFLGAAARIELHWEGVPHVVILGPDAALVRGIHSFEGTLQDGTVLPPHRGTWTGILRRTEGRWRLIHSHSSEPGG